MTLNELADKVYESAKKRGFHDTPRRLPEHLMLAASELGEAFDAWREDPSPTEGSYYEKDGEPKGWGIEIIDCIIVCLDILASERLDADWLMQKKMGFNETRERLHGKGI